MGIGEKMGGINFIEPNQSGPIPASDTVVKQIEGGSSRSTAPSEAAAVRANNGRTLPWRPSAMEQRNKREQVRPINWSNRPIRYGMRTEDWEECANSRVGESTSPAFGE